MEAICWGKKGVGRAAGAGGGGIGLDAMDIVDPEDGEEEDRRSRTGDVYPALYPTAQPACFLHRSCFEAQNINLEHSKPVAIKQKTRYIMNETIHPF